MILAILSLLVLAYLNFGKKDVGHAAADLGIAFLLCSLIYCGDCKADRLRVYNGGVIFTYNTTAASTVVTYGPPSSYVGTFSSAANRPSDIIFFDSFERGIGDPWSFQINTTGGGVFASSTNCHYIRASTVTHQVDLDC